MAGGAPYARHGATDMDTYTVGQAIDHLGFGRFQIVLSMMVGFAQIADAMEMMLLSILGPALHCHWHVTEYQQATLTTVVFLGMLLSSSLWGKMSDSYGRQPTIVWTSFFLFFFGFLTAFAPSFKWVLFLRFLVGVYIGGVPQACVLYAEFLPSNSRGKAIMVLSFFWAVGASLLAFLAWLVMPTMGWRYLVALSTIPLALFLACSHIIPESPMYLASAGRKYEAEAVLNMMARANGKPLLHGNLLLPEKTSKDEGSVKELVSSGRARLSAMVFFLWFVAAFSYYGIVLMSTELLNSSKDTCAASGEAPIDGVPGDSECSVHVCRGLMDKDYVELIKTSFAEFPGTLLALGLIDSIGRKKTLATMSFLFSLATLAVMECSWGKLYLVVILFAGRGFVAGFFQSVYVYTPEVYPTKLRSLAIGFGSGSARVGAMITPYVAQVLLKSSLYTAMAVYAMFGFIAVFVSMFLPIETAGQDLAEASGNSQKPRTGNPGKKGLVDNMEENENGEQRF